MSHHKELFEIASKLEAESKPAAYEKAEDALNSLEKSSNDAGKSFSGSWLGYHAYIYYKNLVPPPPGAIFSQEWGFVDTSFSSLGSRGDWMQYDPDEVKRVIRDRAGNPDLAPVMAARSIAAAFFDRASSDIRSILLTTNQSGTDAFLSRLASELDELKPLSSSEILQIWSPKGQVISRDMNAIGQGTKIPPHKSILAEVASIRQVFMICHEAAVIAQKAASHLERKTKLITRDDRIGTNVFIGHGRSAAWRELKDFVESRLGLPWDEFNRVPVAGITNQTRLAEMLDSAAVALIIMTAEDQTAEGAMQARMNVIHEVGLFQGRLGFTKAIVLLEEGCEEFSNINGLGQIRFPSGNISASFEEVRRVLEREGLIS